MKKIIILLIFSTNVFAANEELFLFAGQPSLLAGINSISDDIGYSIQLGSPKFIRDFLSLQFHWFGMPNYNIFELGIAYTLYSNEFFKFGGKNMFGHSVSKENSYLTPRKASAFRPGI